MVDFLQEQVFLMDHPLQEVAVVLVDLEIQVLLILLVVPEVLDLLSQ
jgi:hypothetical protein